MASPAMCWPTRNTVDSKSALLTSYPRHGPGPLVQGRERRDNAEHAVEDVDHRGAGAQKLPARLGHVRETSHELNDLVERRPLLVPAAV